VLRAAADRERIRATSDDLAFVSITLAGENGVTHMGRDRTVEVAVSGPATLLGLGSACPETEESYVSSRHSTFDGRALAVIRPTGPGNIVVTVEAEGCDPVSVPVQALESL
jgi:hypothetical protein